MAKHQKFSSRAAFVLAAAGSAVGLGNIWKFPYLAAEFGGGIFLIVYLAFVLTIGSCLMLTEIAIGRKTGLSAIGAFRSLSKRWTFLGYLASLVPIIILPYYCVIGGWVTRYFAAFIGGSGSAAAEEGFFDAFVSDTIPPLFWFGVFIAAAAAVVSLGVKRGVEKASVIMMPTLLVLFVILTIYTLAQPGAVDGVRYLFVPDPAHFTTDTVLAALGQMFYSMSLAAGAMITYGSYMQRSENLDESVKQTEWLDVSVALLSGLMIIPAVFVFSGGSEDALTQGPSLMFITMPQVFNSMGSFGPAMGALFFLLVLFAALTSAVSLMETVVSIFQDRFGMGRGKAVLLILGYSLLLAVPASLGHGVWSHIQIGEMNLLDFFDFISNSVLMPVVALLTAVFVGFVLKPQTIVDEVTLSGSFHRQHMYKVIIKWVAPVLLGVILFISIMKQFGFFLSL